MHSTSWRYDDGRVVLTYVVAVRRPDRLNENLVDEPVLRADLARGDAIGGVQIGVAQPIEHAFRHLSWLVKDDAAVREALPDWVALLERYEPEPFARWAAFRADTSARCCRSSPTAHSGVHPPREAADPALYC